MLPLPGKVGRRLAFALMGLYALVLLSVDVMGDWRHLHEDNGAMHTTFALSHLHLGLGETRGHDVYYNPDAGTKSPYGHHPPGTGLLLAAAFSITGSAVPMVARSTIIAFHLVTLALLIRLFGMVSTRAALYGGFVIATLPMSWYFGRMVNYEPLGLFAVTVMLFGWVEVRSGHRRLGLAMLVGGIGFGGLIDWPVFFFAGVIAAFELADGLRGESGRLAVAVTIVATAGVVFAFDLMHLRWATGSLLPLQSVVMDQALEVPSVTALKFVSSQIETCRHYYTHTGLLSAGLLAVALVAPGSRLAEALLDVPRRALVTRFLAIAGIAGSIYILAAPAWAASHAYWQMYLLPYVAGSMVVVLGYACRRAGTDRRWRIVVMLAAIEILATTGYTFTLRYFDTEEYAIRMTEHIRSTYLAPADVRIR